MKFDKRSGCHGMEKSILSVMSGLATHHKTVKTAHINLKKNLETNSVDQTYEEWFVKDIDVQSMGFLFTVTMEVKELGVYNGQRSLPALL